MWWFAWALPNVANFWKGGAPRLPEPFSDWISDLKARRANFRGVDVDEVVAEVGSEVVAQTNHIFTFLGWGDNGCTNLGNLEWWNTGIYTSWDWTVISFDVKTGLPFSNNN